MKLKGHVWSRYKSSFSMSLNVQTVEGSHIMQLEKPVQNQCVVARPKCPTPSLLFNVKAAACIENKDCTHSPSMFLWAFLQ